MKFHENIFWAAVKQVETVHPECRHGQAVFNVMHSLYPEVADRLRGGHLDPFYHSERSDAFIAECRLMIEAADESQ